MKVSKEKRQQYNKKYYLKVRDERLRWKKIKMTCICGKQVTQGRYHTHLTTELHTRWLNKILKSKLKKSS